MLMLVLHKDALVHSIYLEFLNFESTLKSFNFVVSVSVNVSVSCLKGYTILWTGNKLFYQDKRTNLQEWVSRSTKKWGEFNTWLRPSLCVKKSNRFDQILFKISPQNCNFQFNQILGIQSPRACTIKLFTAVIYGFL